MRALGVLAAMFRLGLYAVPLMWLAEVVMRLLG